LSPAKSKPAISHALRRSDALIARIAVTSAPSTVLVQVDDR
jgi:hypothetical protein